MSWVDIREYDGTNETELWDWLGESYLSSEDITFGDTEKITRLKINTIDGEEWAMPGQLLCRTPDNKIKFVDEDWCEENLTKLIEQ